MPMLENRIPPPVMTVMFAAGMWAVEHGWPTEPADARPLWRMAVALLLFVGAGGVGLPAIRAFRGAGTTIDPIHIERASSIVTTGVYRFTRNPMYVSLSMMLVAWALWLGGRWSWLGPVLLVLWLDRFQIRPEERILQARFGEAYRLYCARVRRWL